ncbi:MAG: hypothetical protein ACI9FU_001551, partial [Granulosicoccus sp.]
GNIGWIEDEWLNVKFRGRTGYVFGGYLKTIPAPRKEKTEGELSAALVAYVDQAFPSQSQVVETIEDDVLHCFQLLSDITIFETEIEGGTRKASLTFDASNVFDAYVLLEALIYWNGNTGILESLRFVKNKGGQIDKISDKEGRISLTMVSPNQVKLSITDKAMESASN